MVLGLLGGAGLTGCGDRSPPAVWPRPEPPSLARPLDEAPEPSAERSAAEAPEPSAERSAAEAPERTADEADPAHERASDPAAEAESARGGAGLVNLRPG